MSDRDKIDLMERALREILFARRPGPVPKLIDGAIIERIENIARAVIERTA